MGEEPHGRATAATNALETIFSTVPPDQAANIFAHAADILLVVDQSGTILEATTNLGETSVLSTEAWIGRQLVDLVTPESVSKARKLIEEASPGQKSKFREINHPIKGGNDFPVQYASVALGVDGLLLILGRDISRISSLQQKLMASQLRVEREFAQMRADESRYRMIFQLGDVPYVLVDADTLRVSDISPSAKRLLGVSQKRLEDTKISALFDADGAETLHALLRAAADDGAGNTACTISHDGDQVKISAVLFRQERRGFMLLRLELASQDGQGASSPLSHERRFLNVVNVITDGFVITNSAREILAVNPAIVHLLGLSSAKDLEGTSIDQWFDRPNVDYSVLMANIKEHQKVWRFATVLRTQFGQLENVEIAAVEAEHRGESLYGFVIRPMSAALAANEAEGRDLAQTDEQVASLVGHMPLKDIVRQTTETLETLCIETALELTKGNRALAAQMLGLSRQSLYAKLGKTKSEDEE